MTFAGGSALGTVAAERSGPTALDLRLPALAAVAWLAALEARGVGVETIVVTPGASGTVAARATLRVMR